MQIISIVVVVVSSLAQLATAVPVQGKKVDLFNQKNKYFQGDIFNVPLHPNKLRNGLKFNSTLKWPNATIPYVLTVAESRKALVLAVMKNITLKTCVKFVKNVNVNVNNRSQLRQHHVIQGRVLCYSSVGVEGSRQDVSLQDDSTGTCMSTGSIMHELLHAVGLWHEHSRYDRDTAVIIVYSNIPYEYRDQFAIVSSLDSDVYGIPFDYTSFMLYSAYAFSKSSGTSAPTIVPKVSGYLNTIGNAIDASANDFLKVRKIYNCPVCQDDPNYIAYCATFAPYICYDTAVQAVCRKSCGLCKW